MNYGPGPSRPPPIPYDDPYSESFTGVSADGDGGGSATFNNIRDDTSRRDSIRPVYMSVDGSGTSVRASGRTLDHGLRPHNPRGRGRGGGRNRQSDRGRRGRGKGAPQHSPSHQTFPQQSGSHDYSNLTPPSGFFQPYGHQQGHGGGGQWNYNAPMVTPQPPVLGFGSQSTFPGVQPHINPRFANQLGFNFSQISQIPQILPGVTSPPPSEQYDTSDTHSQTAARHHQWGEGGG
jgi:H/ACA ribonucleoprotein complex non-core subunit NAF1